MTERPIIFSAPMVRAIIDGRKTMTRRVVQGDILSHSDGAKRRVFGKDAAGIAEINALLSDQRRHPCHRVACPYGQPGDRLWVREAWRVAECYDGKSGSELHGILSARNVQYAVAADQFLGVVQGRYRHARFMPRWASRITLEITCVRVERLQDISDADALAEGIYPTRTGLYPGATVAEFCNLWQSIHGPGSWEANPWVWVIEFRKAEHKA